MACVSWLWDRATWSVARQLIPDRPGSLDSFLGLERQSQISEVYSMTP